MSDQPEDPSTWRAERLAVQPSPTWRARVALLTTDVAPSRLFGAGLAVVALAVLAVVALRPPSPGTPELTLPVAGGPDDPGATSSSTALAPGDISAGPDGEVHVHAAGAVVSAGVYRLASGARVADALEAAGGPAPDADLDRLNLAAPLVDGQQVYVPRRGEPVPPGTGGPSGVGETATGPIDVNTASADQLDALPGVGPAIAAAIVEERDRRGGFRSVDDLLDVRGIGDAKLAELRDLVTV